MDNLSLEAISRIRSCVVFFDEEDETAHARFLLTEGEANKELARIRSEAKAEALREAAPDYDHYWQIVLHWAKDDGQAIKRLSVLQMRTLCERLESITRHAILADQPKNTNSAAEVKIIDPGPGGIDGIMILADQAPEAEKVEGPQVDDKVYVPPCEACGNVNRHNPSCPIMRERRIQEWR